MRIAILGAGAFGTALAVHLHRLSHEPVIWTRSASQIVASSGVCLLE